MVVTVFRTRARANLGPDVMAQLTERGARMIELALSMPGFVSYKDFSAEDGETVTVVEFETHEQLAAWRDHPEHRATQVFGRAEVFSEYQVQVCDVVRTARFSG